MAKHKCWKETEIALMKQRQDQDHVLLVEVHAAVVGKSDEPGLKGRVESVEKSQDNMKVIGGIIAFFITVGISLLAIFKK